MQDGIQRHSRTKMVLPLRVWLDERASETAPSQWAHTIDTCEVGCRLGGLRSELSPGQIITVQRGQYKAPFRVIWCRQLAPHENQAGIEAVDQRTNIWNMNSMPAIDRVEASPAQDRVPSLAVSKVPALNVRAQQKSNRKAPQRGLRWALSFGFLILTLALGLLFYHRLFSQSQRAEIGPLLPAPPTARDLARLTPKPHLMLASLTKPLDSSTIRLQVAEAPTGRVVYPVPPFESISGKVQLQVVIAANGLVKQIHLLSGKQPLAEAAAEAVRLWHYASLQGIDRSTDRETTVTVSFLGGDAVSLQFPSAKFGAPISKSE
jgi:hypothetical protein